MNIEFTIPGEPKAQQRHRTGKGGHRYDPSKADKDAFLAQAMKYRPKKPIDGPISVRVKAWFKRPKKHYRTGRFSHQLKDDAPMYHAKVPDGDNILKFVLDAMNGVFWVDDCLAYSCSVYKCYAMGSVPRTEIQIEWDS